MKIPNNFTTLLVFVLSLITFQTEIFAARVISKEAAEDYRLQGFEAQQKGNLDEALTFYTKAMALKPDNVSVVYNDTGIVYEKLGLKDRAEEYYLQAIREDPQYLPSYMNLAYLYKDQGQTQKAVEYFHRRVVLAKEDDFWVQKAKQEIFALDPSYRQKILLKEAHELQQELIRQAGEELAQKVAKADDYYDKGKILAQKEEYNKAIAYYNQALLLTPNNPKILKAREDAMLKRHLVEVKRRSEYAFKFLNAGDTLSAKEEFRRILTIIPDEPVLISE
jgi:tetratricopeptide (TPR) repeat protein